MVVTGDPFLEQGGNANTNGTNGTGGMGGGGGGGTNGGFGGSGIVIIRYLS